MNARTAAPAVGVALTVGYVIGRYRPLHRAHEWAIDQVVFRVNPSKPRQVAALAVVMVAEPRKHRDIWLNVLTFGRHELPEPKRAPAPRLRVLTPEERAERLRLRREEDAVLRDLDPDGDR